MEKVRKYSDNWGEYNCSSNRNIPKLIKWIDRWDSDESKYTIYIDKYILTDGLKNPNREKLGWILESPQIIESTINEIKKNHSLIKEHYSEIYTCLDDLLSMGEPFKYTVSNAVPWIWEENRLIHNKTKLISMIASNKGWVKGHRNRLQWVEKLKDKVDLFGTGRPNQLKDKEDGLKDYMFSVSIENDNSDLYFTEKLTDNFVMGTVPVYWGSRKVIEKYFDPRGVIFLDDDPNLESISTETYENMLPYIKNNFELIKELPISEDYIFKNYLQK